MGAMLIGVLYLVLYFSFGYGTQSAYYPTPWSDLSGLSADRRTGPIYPLVWKLYLSYGFAGKPD